MNATAWLFLISTAALLIYLLVALLYPERF